MILQFLEPGMDKALSYPGFYDPALVILSLFAAYLGAFSGLSVIQHLRDQKTPRKKLIWLTFGTIVLGNGVFAMHFMGILAHTLPIPLWFDLDLTLYSSLPAMLAAALMLHLVSRRQKDGHNLWLGGAIGGAGVGLMHYIGMMAIHMEARMLFDPLLFALSIIVAMAFTNLAIRTRYLCRILGLNPDVGTGRQIGPLIMGVAISGMHYTAMAATWFFPGKSRHDPTDFLLEPGLMKMGLAIVFFILIIAALVSIYLGFGQSKSDERIQRLASVFQPKNRHLFLKHLAIVLGVVAMASWIFSYIQEATEHSSQKYAGKLELDRVVKGAAHDFESIIFDLNMLIGSGYLAEFLDNNGTTTKKNLIRQFEFVAKERRVYDQIRFINNQGMEMVRINANQDGVVSVVPTSQLQNKANKGYFKSAFGLSQGELHISRFDLNMEHGQVEVPHKPMIRFSAPVFDRSGQKKGVVVLNYLGDIILDYIRNVFETSKNKVYIIDQLGYFLLTPDSNDAWGFMFARPITFATKFPVMWKYLQDRDSGSFHTELGQFIFATLTVALHADLKPKFGRNGETWKVVIRIDDALWSLADLDEHPMIAIILLWILLLSFLIAWFATLLIISRRIFAETEAAALREINFQKLALDEHAIVSATDVKGNITYVNDKFVAISGYSREQLLGQNHRMVKSSEHSEQFYREMWKTIVNRKPWHGEVRNLAKNGQSYWVRATIVPFLNEQGKPFKYVSIRTDITAMKALETNLIKAKEGAEAAAQAKSDFLANMSHEIRTPMNAVIGLSHLCLQTRLTARQKDYIRKVHNSATSLLRIINDILDFSKIEAGRLDMENIDFTLEEVLGNMATMIALKTQEKRLEFLMETAVNIPPSLVGDPLRLGQVLINLANNAIKFTEAGEVVVVTNVLEREEDFVRLQFTIRDTGIGMTQAQIAGLFQAFSQADTSITRKFGGTGLGLTISQRLITMMDGTIRVESEPSVGSKFIFDVRLGVSNRVMEKTLVPSTDLRGMKVLAVDDNESARNVISDYLTSFTFKVSKARDGKDAICIVQEADMAGEPFDLVVMDYMMPEIDGITAAAKIRNELGLSQPPVIIMATAYGDESVVKRAAQEAQVDGFLVKPINQGLLFEAIMEAFGQATLEGKKSRGNFGENKNFHALLSGARILLVEDNEINQQVARELLEQANITVILAENGKEAVDLVYRETLDGVLMDVQMPIMDGLTATKEIRKDPRFANLPILAMTANAMSGDREQCLEVGMQDHIAKPVDPEEMFSTLAQWIKPASPQPLPAITYLEEDLQDEPQQKKVPTSTLPEIAGIDVQAGLKRMGGNLKGYMGLLAKFRANQGGTVTTIRKSLANKDRETAERLAHTLKGVSATIGTVVLQEKAKVLESGIKHGEESTQIEALLTETATILGEICAAIDHTLPASKPDAAPQYAETETEQTINERNALFQEASRQLAVFDAAVEHTMASLQKLQLSHDMTKVVEKIAEKVANYDFEGAAEELQQCIRHFGIDLENNDG